MKKESSYKISKATAFYVLEYSNGWRIRVGTLNHLGWTYITLAQKFSSFEDADEGARMLADKVKMFAESFEGVEIP